MNITQSQPDFNLDEEENGGIDLMALVNILLGKWYWFVISAILCVGIAAVKIYFSPKIFYKQTTILIKDPKSNSQSATFADIAGMSGLASNNTENEMIILRSRFLMEEAVEQLGAHITYFQEQHLRKVELYESTPFRVVAPEGTTLMPASFQITVQDHARFRYTSADTSFVAPFNTGIQFPFGYAIVSSRPQWLGYYINKPVDVFIGSVRGTAAGYLGGLSIMPVSKGTNVLNLGMRSSRPGKAADILNKLVEVYNTAAINDKNFILDNSARFISDRLDIVRRELGEVDGRIESYKRSTLSSNASSEGSMYINSASSLEEKRSANELQISLLNSLRDFMQRAGTGRDLLPYNIGLDNAGLNAQIQTYNENLIRMNRMIDASSERNPVVADLNGSLESLRSSIEKTVDDMNRSLLLTQRELDQRAVKTTGKIEAASTHERNVQSITRDQKIKAELYLYLLNKSEENAILKSMTEPNARVLDKAFGSESPISPQREKIALAGLLIGLLIPGAWFILKDLLYTKVRGRSDVTRVVKAPLLGEIPSKPERLSDRFLVVENGSNTQLSEAFRILRTNLSFLNPDSRQQVIAFTSTLPGEGKTYISANMAMALALSGKKVCLVGLDLRRPTLQKAFNLKGKKGVSDFLVQAEHSLENLIQRLPEHENLYLLPAGTVPPNPAELLMNTRFDEMIAELRTRFDYIVLDHPPMHIVSDTAIANRVVDITLYVVRAGYLSRKELSVVQDLYKEQKLHNMGIVITDVDYERLYYSVGYTGYGKRYGYYGGYSAYGKGYYSAPVK
ncbi:MAG: polysaccharide biosynthesis tyrosine autokinase [Odoribacter sp.]